jgi:hypothetical protein
MKTTVLKFPNPIDFFDWLRKQYIHEYGSVIIEDKRTGQSSGIPFVTFSIRMTARDSVRNEIVQCELPFWNGILINPEVSKKEAEETEKKMKEYVEKVHKEAFKDYQIAVIPAEFMSGEETN